MSNNIDALRGHLFDARKGLKDKTMTVETAKAMSEVSQTIINSAKAEVEHAKATGKKGNPFLESGAGLPVGITGIHKHVIR